MWSDKRSELGHDDECVWLDDRSKLGHDDECVWSNKRSGPSPGPDRIQIFVVVVEEEAVAQGPRRRGNQKDWWTRMERALVELQVVVLGFHSRVLEWIVKKMIFVFVVVEVIHCLMLMENEEE